MRDLVTQLARLHDIRLVSLLRPGEEGLVDDVATLGVEVVTAVKVADDPDATRTALDDLCGRCDIAVTSGNSLAGYCKPENVRALAEAVQRYGEYPLSF